MGYDCDKKNQFTDKLCRLTAFKIAHEFYFIVKAGESFMSFYQRHVTFEI